MISGMKVEVEERPGCRRVLSVEVPAQEAEGRLEAMLDEMRKDVTIPGFRKGKVSTRDLRGFLGPAIKDEFLRKVLPQVYDEALGRADLHPVSAPDISDVEYTPGFPFRFKAEVDVRPNVDPSDYRGLRAVRRLHVVDERDVEEAVQYLRIRRAAYTPVEREAREGDFVDVSLDEPAEGSSTGATESETRGPRELTLELGSDATPPEFHRALLGARAGDAMTVAMPSPVDRADASGGGKERRFEVRVLRVQERNLPALDDAFAQEALAVPDLDHLRQRIRLDLEAEDFRRANDDVREALLDDLVRRNPLEVPASLVEGYLARLLERAREEKPGLAPEEEAEIRDRYRPRVERQLRIDFLLEAVGRKEGITVTDAEVEAEIARIAATERKEPAEVKAILRKNGEIGRLTDHLFTRKVLAFLSEAARVETEKTARRNA
jgi:trigger factor